MEKPRPGMIGIYQIKNLNTGEVYIGSSMSINNRLKNHMTDLVNGIHINKSLQDSWRLHGAECFQFSILEIVEDRDRLHKRELYWIEKTGALHVGFNTKTDQYKERTLISVHMSTKKALENLKLGSMNKTIQHLLRFYMTNTQLRVTHPHLKEVQRKYHARGASRLS